MEWELVRPWVNRVGIMLAFLAFWLAAPEILGEERLRKMERRVEQGPEMVTNGAVVVVFTGISVGRGAVGVGGGLYDGPEA